MKIISKLSLIGILAIVSFMTAIASDHKDIGNSKDYFNFGDKVVYLINYSYDNVNSRMEGQLIYKIDSDTYRMKNIWLATNLFHTGWLPRFGSVNEDYQIVNGNNESIVDYRNLLNKYFIKYSYPLVDGARWKYQHGYQTDKGDYTICGVYDDKVTVTINGNEYSNCVIIVETGISLEHDAYNASVVYEWLAPKLGSIKRKVYSVYSNGITSKPYETYLLSYKSFDIEPTEQNIKALIENIREEEKNKFEKGELERLIKDGRYHEQ